MANVKGKKVIRRRREKKNVEKYLFVTLAQFISTCGRKVMSATF